MFSGKGLPAYFESIEIDGIAKKQAMPIRGQQVNNVTSASGRR